MLGYGFLELSPTVFLTTLGQHIDHLTARFRYPVDGSPIVHKAQYLNTVELIDLLGIAADHRHRFLVAVADLR